MAGDPLTPVSTLCHLFANVIMVPIAGLSITASCSSSCNNRLQVGPGKPISCPQAHLNLCVISLGLRNSMHQMLIFHTTNSASEELQQCFIVHRLAELSPLTLHKSMHYILIIHTTNSASMESQEQCCACQVQVMQDHCRAPLLPSTYPRILHYHVTQLRQSLSPSCSRLSQQFK